MLLTLYTVVVILLLFGVTIFVHELGHFLVARRCGMVIEAFSIGFGPALWKKTVHGVVYKIGIIPFGGYVALPQMDPSGPGDKEAEEKQKSLPRVAPWKKILVALAGVTGNMILAVIIAYIVYWKGQSFAPVKDNTIIGYVETNCAAYAGGIRIGDSVDSVNAKPVTSWEQFALVSALYDRLDLAVGSPSGGVRHVALSTDKLFGGRFVKGLYPMNYCYVLRVDPGSSADEAGIRRGDRILEFNGQTLFSREHLIDLVNQARDLAVPAKIDRDGVVVGVTVRPKFDESIGRARIGVVFNTLDVKKPAAQIKSHAMLIFRLLQALVTPKESKAAAQSVGGPVAILGMFWLYVQTSFIMALWFTGLLNVNLAVLNLLPIPILDGGHILFSLWEMITRRPISAKIVNAVMNTFAALIIALFIVLTYRDIFRFLIPLFSKSGKAPAAQVTTNLPPSEVVPPK